MTNTRTRGYVKQIDWKFSAFMCVVALVLNFGYFNGYWGATEHIIQTPTFENYRHISVQQHIEQEAKNNGLEAWKVLALVNAESSFNQYAININRNGTIDRGLFQFNNKAHPEVSDECAFSIPCSTKNALLVIKSRGWKEWSANKYLKF
jgi:hypothetical protein